jgi:hypothetical protein
MTLHYVQVLHALFFRHQRVRQMTLEKAPWRVSSGGGVIVGIGKCRRTAV